MNYPRFLAFSTVFWLLSLGIVSWVFWRVGSWYFELVYYSGCPASYVSWYGYGYDKMSWYGGWGWGSSCVNTMTPLGSWGAGWSSENYPVIIKKSQPIIQINKTIPKTRQEIMKERRAAIIAKNKARIQAIKDKRMKK